ncbi:hypothetical protein H8356DRAFT_1364291 [Neocallimastix lanati (nom. inval.)]|nr:hypothetical protein H8356DRAFT_1364291 [Neocallimastix sp. JGI-2020a]
MQLSRYSVCDCALLYPTSPNLRRLQNCMTWEHFGLILVVCCGWHTYNKGKTLRPPVSPLNISDSHWILCHTVSHSLYDALYDGLLFNDFLNHHQGQRNYINPLTDQEVVAETYL